MNRTEQYVEFAIRYGVDPSVAHALPSLFEHAAREVDASVDFLLQSAKTNRELGEYLAYLAGVAAKAAAIIEARDADQCRDKAFGNSITVSTKPGERA